ncbi:hypothetical protein H4R24_002631 [Coemansia sp. RSA 988]|nr:hypothetical protein H4R24_002631 [Coemansia sp. RSA 988]
MGEDRREFRPEQTFDEHVSGQVTEELSGFDTEMGGTDNTEILRVDTMSDIGGVVSQAEAGMDFSTNVDAPMEGVRKQQQQHDYQHNRTRVGHMQGVVGGGGVEDMSMSRLAESYWKPQRNSSFNEFTHDDLRSMEFSTHSAEDNGQQLVDTTTGRHTRSDEGRIIDDDGFSHSRQAPSHQGRFGSFHSDSMFRDTSQRVLDGSWGQGSVVQTQPRRPESYHDGPSHSSIRTQERLPTLSSPRVSGAAAIGDRFARLAARYFRPQGTAEVTEETGATARSAYGSEAGESSDRMSDMLPAMPDTPDIHTAFTSDQMSVMSPSPSPPVAGMSGTAGQSIVERTQTALQMRLVGVQGDAYGAPRPALATRAQSQPTIDTTDNGEAARRPALHNTQSAITGSYQHMAAFSMGSRSQESLDHPNMGSQRTQSAASSLASLEAGAYYGGATDTGLDAALADERFTADGVVGAPEYYNNTTEGRFDAFDTHRGGSFGSAQYAMQEGERFLAVDDADQLFGEGPSSSGSPGLSAIARDHEQVFHDLFSSGSTDELREITDEFDAAHPPASLFASSASIVAEISRRRAQTHGERRAFAPWDGREATQAALQLQEQQYGLGAHNPMELMEKENSLGISDVSSNVSGLLLTSEFSPNAAKPHPPPLHLHPLTPQSAAPPPTTPTTFLSRDTHHRPASREPYRVAPFATEADAAMQNQRRGGQRRPGGPRALESVRPSRLDVTGPVDQRNARAAAEFAEAAREGSPANTDDGGSHGLGSLLHDSLPTLEQSRLSRRSGTPRTAATALQTRIGATRSGDMAESSASSLTANGAYVPFQEPTVDVSQLVRYGDVAIDHNRAPPPWALHSRPAGVSADRIESPAATARRLPLVRARQLNSGSAIGSDGAAPTVRLGSPTPTSSAPCSPPQRQAQTGPTLADIYALLKRTASSLDNRAPQPMHEADAYGDADQSLPAVRPSAPTPRAGRAFPRSQTAPESEDHRGAPLRSPTRVPRHTSDAAASYGGSSHMQAFPQPRRSTATAAPVEANDLAGLVQSLAIGGDSDDVPHIPLPLAERLLELATELARARPAAQTGEAARAEALREELRRLQHDVLARLDEQGAAVDMLRAEVRLGSTASTLGPAHRAASPRTHSSLSPVPRTPPPAQIPSTAQNKQHRMAQWLDHAHEPRHASPSHSLRRRQKQLHRRAAEVAIDEEDDESIQEAYADADSLSDASTTVPEPPTARSPLRPMVVSPRAPRHSPAVGDLLSARQTLDAVRERAKAAEDDSFSRHVYSAQMAKQLAHTLAELQRVHLQHFHGRTRKSCPVCDTLEQQQRDPYLFGRHAMAYKSMSTRELQGLLNAYVVAMEAELAPHAASATAKRSNSPVEPLAAMPQSRDSPRHSFTPSRSRKLRADNSDAVPADPRRESAHRVLGLLHEELDALSRRYYRLVEEYRRLSPVNVEDQRRRRQMARELKDLVDLLDVKGEQISVLADLHPGAAQPPPQPKQPASPSPRSTRGSIQRAFQSAKELQQALGDLY